MTLLARAYRRVMEACGTAAALLFGAVAVLVSFDVVLRNLGFGTLPWIVEVSEYSLPVATFLSAPWLLHHNGHIRIDTLATALPPRWAAALEIGVDALGLAVCAVMFWYGLAIIGDSRGIGALVIKTLVFPEWWLFVPLPAASLLIAAEFARRIGRALTAPGA